MNAGELDQLRRDVDQLQRDLIADSRMTDEQAEITELRVAAIEEVLAARWPRRLLLRWRLVRDLRASAAGYGWVGPGFGERGAQAVADGWVRPWRHR